MQKWPAVILAGGLGTRLGEITESIPKPMVTIGRQPILWHIMKHYSTFGVNRFFILGGYKCDVIKRYFAEYTLNKGDIEVDLARGQVSSLSNAAEDWQVRVMDTGDSAGTAQRILRARDALSEFDGFYLTYGDGVSDVDVTEARSLLDPPGVQIALTAVCPPGRYGQLSLGGNLVRGFEEKAPETGLINGGFFAVKSSFLDLISDAAVSFEADVLPEAASAGQLAAYAHLGFWQSMDTPRDLQLLRELWASPAPKWRTWET